MTILLNDEYLESLGQYWISLFNTTTYVEIYEGTMPTEADMEEPNNAWHTNRSGDLLIQWYPAQLYRYNDAGQINAGDSLRARIVDIPDPTTATKSGTGTCQLYIKALPLVQ